MAKKRRSQPKLPDGPRIPTGSSLASSIRTRVELDAKTYNVSRSWVQACILAEYYALPCSDYRVNDRIKKGRK